MVLVLLSKFENNDSLFKYEHEIHGNMNETTQTESTNIDNVTPGCFRIIIGFNDGTSMTKDYLTRQMRDRVWSSLNLLTAKKDGIVILSDDRDNKVMINPDSIKYVRMSDPRLNRPVYTTTHYSDAEGRSFRPERGELNLDTMYQDISYVDESEEEDRALLYTELAEEGDPEAMIMAAKMFLEGRNPYIDRRTAMTYIASVEHDDRYRGIRNAIVHTGSDSIDPILSKYSLNPNLPHDDLWQDEDEEDEGDGFEDDDCDASVEQDRLCRVTIRMTSGRSIAMDFNSIDAARHWHNQHSVSAMKSFGSGTIENTMDCPFSFEVNGDNVDYIMIGPKPRGRRLVGFEEVDE